MRVVALDAITIPQSRIRKEFPDAAKADLIASILEDGLLQPIVVREANGKLELVAGERRYRALREIKTSFRFDTAILEPGLVPVASIGEVLDSAAYRAQAMENLRRVDFTWQERAAAFAELHRLRSVETNGLQPKSRTVSEIIKSRRPNNADVAELTSSLTVVDYLHDPEVAKAKSLREAEAVVEKRLQAAHDAKVAEVVKTQVSPHNILHGKCEALLPTLPDAHLDVIVADPLYGINAHKHAPASGSESAYKHDYDDSLDNAVDMWLAIAREGWRVTKPKAHIYIFHDFTRWSVLRDVVDVAGWTIWPRPIIWDKQAQGMIGDYRHGPARAYESILYAYKGEKEVTGVFPEIIRITNTADTSLNAAAKPVELYVDLLRRSCRPGDRVLDPCCGTGPIFPAANRLNLYATGIEASEVLYNRCLMRLGER